MYHQVWRIKMVAKSLTLRIPAELYKESRVIAEERRISFNSLVQECLQSMVKAEEDKVLYAAFGLVGGDGDETNVNFALPAQQEVIEHDA